MLLKKIAGKNSFVALMLQSGIIVAHVVIIFILVASYPGAFGSPPPAYSTREIYHFEPWHFEVNGLEVFFPEGGIIVPLYLEEKQEAALITGYGEYSSATDPLHIENPAGIYLVINQDTFDARRGDIIFIPVADEDTRAALSSLVERQPGLPVVWQSAIPLAFLLHGNALYYYFITDSGEPVFPPALHDSPGNLYAALAIYILFFLVVLVVLNIFSIDHHPSRYWQFIHCTKPGAVALIAVPVAAGLALGGELLPWFTGWPDYSAAAGCAAAVLTLLLLNRLKRIDFLDFGLRRDSIRYGYLMAGAAAVMFLIIAREFPESLSFHGVETLVQFLKIFFLVALIREMIWRGFIQTTVGRRFGAAVGVLTTAILASLLHLVYLYVTEPWLLSYPFTYVEIAVLVPGTAVVLGFLYLRTENIVSCAFLHSLILFLPRIIVQ